MHISYISIKFIFYRIPDIQILVSIIQLILLSSSETSIAILSFVSGSNATLPEFC